MAGGEAEKGAEAEALRGLSPLGPRAVTVERRVRCQSAPAALWEVITDTERLNRAAGLGRLELSPISDGSAARYLARTRIGPFQITFEERPFEWVYPRRFQVLRRYRAGPARAVETSFFLEPAGEGGGTDLTVRVAIEPGVPLIGPLLRLQAAQVVGRLAREAARLDPARARPGQVPTSRVSRVPRAPRPSTAPPEPAPASLNTTALARAAAELRRTEPDLADRLAALVAGEDDPSVGRIRPFALADAWGVGRRETLAACLRAVRAGLLELRWEVVCPSCRTASATMPTLAELEEHARCQLCDLGFQVDLDEAVEATFGPAPAVRAVDAGPYCIGGPARTPHVVAQAILPPGGVGRLEVPLEDAQAAASAGPEDAAPGGAGARRYRLFVRGGAAARVEVAEGAPAEARVDAEAPDAAGPIAIAPGGLIAVENAQALERHAKLERLTWSEQAATARILTSMAEFRRDFSGDVLRPGAALRVSRVSLLFSDLTDSTLLYTTAGDAAAFKLVHDHFDVVVPLIEQARGAVVKTIGDAVMAAFADELDGLAASLAVLEAFERFRARSGDAARTHIKLGLHSGPCYVITANGALDYFGQTVNIAARLQAQAKSGELVVDAALAERAIAAGALPASRVRERCTVALKGVEPALTVARIRLPGQARVERL
uniref:Guanylate cyclase domain-containing protein n=1 Tax=Jahnella sp. MSr9139 TaxID=1434086 RepID=A0A4Y5SZC1_9BACT|nr:hypothetical protein [Jahnella sp. MSr9139]